MKCEHPALRSGDTFDQLRRVEPCLYCQRDALKARLAEAEATLSLASQAIDERLSGLAGDPLQDVADAISRYYAPDSASGEGEK